jgi:hypothetical protein
MENSKQEDATAKTHYIYSYSASLMMSRGRRSAVIAKKLEKLLRH